MDHLVPVRPILGLMMVALLSGGPAGAQLYSVSIKADDPPALRTNNGKLALGTVERWGQGIIIDPSGVIVTNKHIIGRALHIHVVLSDGKMYEGRLLRYGKSDLCLIKIDPSQPLKWVSLTDSSQVRIGENVIAISRAGTAARKLGGQVINIYREGPSNRAEIVEINIPLEAGDSGGPILNEDGSFLGLIMGKRLSDPSKSYAIASYRIQQEFARYRNSW